MPKQTIHCERSNVKNLTTAACGREFLMGVVARVLMDEPGEDLFTHLRMAPQFARRIGIPDGPGTRPRLLGALELAIVEHMEEDLERWDGLS